MTATINPSDLTKQPELPGLANRIVDSLEHRGQATKLVEESGSRSEASEGIKPKKPRTPSNKANLARKLNRKKAQLLNSYVTMRGCTPSNLRTQLEYCFKATLRTLQQTADQAGIKGNYLTFLPEEETQVFKKHAKQAGMTVEEFKAMKDKA